MKKIARNEAEPGQNSPVCKTIEYSFGDTELDLGIATITGRFPDHGYAMNEVCRELVYVLEGEGCPENPDGTAKNHQRVEGRQNRFDTTTCHFARQVRQSETSSPGNRL